MSTFENQILRFLGQQVDFVDAQTIAQAFDVSPKTVYRAVSKLNQDDIVIESQRGRGYRLVANKILPANTEQDTQRQHDLVISLLHAFPHGSNRWQLLEKFYISDSTLQKDLTTLNELLNQFHTSIDRSAGQVRVVGTETQVRKALNYFLLENRLTQQVVAGVDGVFPDILPSDQAFLSAQMTLIEKELNVEILDPYTINIFSHLYILLNRVRQHDVAHEPEDDTGVRGNDLFVRVARQVINNIGEYINTTIDEQEVHNLVVYLVGLRYNRDLDMTQEGEAQQLVDYLIDSLNLPPHVNINNLKKGLIGHVRPMIHRLKEDMLVVNPLITDIKFSYQQTFDDIKTIVNKTPYQISDDEIGFLALYVVRALEEASAKKRVLLMCSTGVGTAQLLQTKVKRAFPDFDIAGTVSARDYQEHLSDYQDVDLVISTVNVQFQPVSPVIQVSALFNEGDRRRIEEMLYD